jgi:hypothetical protein
MKGKIDFVGFTTLHCFSALLFPKKGAVAVSLNAGKFFQTAICLLASRKILINCTLQSPQTSR